MKLETFKNNHPAAYLLCNDNVDMRFISPVTIEILEELAMYGYCRPCKCKGRGRFSKNDDRTAVIESLLAEGKTDYVKINDAPRGSDTGNVIILAGKDSFGYCWSRTIAGDGEYMLHYAGQRKVHCPGNRRENKRNDWQINSALDKPARRGQSPATFLLKRK